MSSSAGVSRSSVFEKVATGTAAGAGAILCLYVVIQLGSIALMGTQGLASETVSIVTLTLVPVLTLAGTLCGAIGAVRRRGRRPILALAANLLLLFIALTIAYMAVSAAG